MKHIYKQTKYFIITNRNLKIIVNIINEKLSKFIII